jgi:hypothetical protein
MIGEGHIYYDLPLFLSQLSTALLCNGNLAHAWVFCLTIQRLGSLENTALKMSQEQLRVLIVGNGGREHALAWKLSQSPRVEIIYVAPGNGGTGLGATSKIFNANVKGDNYPGLVAFAQKNGVNLVVPGPEAPLVDGIQGYFQAGGKKLNHEIKRKRF